MAAANTAPSKARSMAEWVTQSSVAFVRLGSLPVTCTWQSMKPGVTVA